MDDKKREELKRLVKEKTNSRQNKPGMKLSKSEARLGSSTVSIHYPVSLED